MRGRRLALVCLFWLGCHRPPPPPSTEGARRIVSLTPSWTEVAYAIGAADRLVGVDERSDWPAAAKGLPQVGSGLQPSLERILALKPDLVLLSSSYNAPDLAATFARLGVPVLVSQTVSLAGVYDDMERLGKVVGQPHRARELVAALKERVARVERRVAERPRPPTAIVVWSEPLTLIGSGTFVAEALAKAGGDNVAADSPQPYPQYSVERLLAHAPTVLIVGKQQNGPAMAPLWRLAVPAVRLHRVYEVDANLLFRPGPRLVDGIEALSRILHP